jgi:outer membrane protein assembly factor BamB
MRKTLLITAFLVAALGAASAAAGHRGPGHGSKPTTIALPNGFQPEGLAIRGRTFYTGSLATGAVYAGSLETGAGALVVQPQSGRSATGIAVDHGRLYVAGGATGKAFVYDARTGADLGSFQLATGASFINGVVVTRKTVWFTDSTNPVLYRLALGPHRALPAQAQSVPLGGDIHYGSGFNANGIQATPNGKKLVIVQSNTGLVFTVDPATGAAHAVTGVSVPNGDGILLAGRWLFIVRNFDNTVDVVRLAHGLGSGTVVRHVTDPDFDIPASIDRAGRRLYVVNARFTTPPTPTTTYSVVRVDGV